MSQNPTLLLIRGLGHSGTTILDLALGAHPQVMGLGEASRILETPKPGEEQRGPAMLRGPDRSQRLCTCGATADNCPIWGPALQWLERHEQRTLPEKMEHLMGASAAAASMLGAAPQVLVDSFQDEILLPQSMAADVDVRIIHLVRDVRSWLHSRLKASRQSRRALSDIRTLARWWYVNRKFDRILQQCGRPVFRLGYEEFALHPEQSLRLICNWLGLPFHRDMLMPGGNSSSHILSGNRMRFDQEKTRIIRYDGEWMMTTEPMVRLAMLIPPVRLLNQRLVYSNRILCR